MIDFSRVLSGYDIEVQVGNEFFLQALSALFESDDVETEFEITDGQVTINPPSSLVIRFDTETLREFDDNGNDIEVEKSVDLEITFPVDAIVDFNGNPLPLSFESKVFLLLEQAPIENTDTGLINKVELNPVYQGMDNDTRNLILQQSSRQQFEEIEDNIRQISEVKLTDQLVPGATQKMAIRKLPTQAGFQSCYALYANLDLKLGPLNETQPINIGGQVAGVRTIVLPPEPDSEPVDRGDEDLGINFLPADEHIAMAAPKEIYDRLEVDRMHRYTESNDSGGWSRPLRKPAMNPREEGPIIGHYKSLNIEPTKNKENDFGAIKATARVHIDKANTDATNKIYFHPRRRSDGTLWWDVDVTEPEADLSIFYIIFGILSLALAFPVIIGIGFLGFTVAGVLSGISMTFVKSIAENFEEEAQQDVQKMVERQKDGLLNFLSKIPTRITVVRRREDPLFYRHYQVVSDLSIKIVKDGIGFVGQSGTGVEDRPIDNVKLVGRTRNTEPVGELINIHYQVPREGEIVDIQNFIRPDPVRKPRVFAITPDDARGRVNRSQLKVATIINPERVRVRSGRVSEIYFSEGIALAPAEAGRMHIGRVLSLTRLKLIKPRGLPPYYRTKPDVFEHNNLTQWPAYEAYRSWKLSLELAENHRQYRSYLEDVSQELWSFAPSADSQTVGASMFHLVSGIALLRSAISDFLAEENISNITDDSFLQAAALNRPDDQVGISEVLNLLETHAERLQDQVAELGEVQLRKTADSGFHQSTRALFVYIRDIGLDFLGGNFRTIRGIQLPPP